VSEPSAGTVLLVRAGARVCALPVEHVVETMRPLPAAPLSGTPVFVRGAAVVRGQAVPVIDLEAFLGERTAQPARRFVLVHCGKRAAALAVTDVIGVHRRGPSVGGPPLLSAACAGAVESMAVLDEQLLLVLRAARVVPEDVWRALEGAGVGT
jgi:purine-binding chemotaxis protein CheW